MSKREFREDNESELLFEKLLLRVKQLPPMTPAQKRAQAISWVAGNLLVDRPDDDPWIVLLQVTNAYDQINSGLGTPRKPFNPKYLVASRRAPEAS